MKTTASVLYPANSSLPATTHSRPMPAKTLAVLDEATAFADPENEYKMQQALQSLIKGKTVIIIAHRLSSIVSADNIVVLQQGRIVQQGRHDDLSVAEGLYKNMWNAYTSAYHWKLNKN